MNTTTDLLKQLINQVNLKLEEMETGCYIELNGCILDLVKGNEHYCLLVESDKHEMFAILMYIANFMVLLNYMKVHV